LASQANPTLAAKTVFAPNIHRHVAIRRLCVVNLYLEGLIIDAVGQTSQTHPNGFITGGKLGVLVDFFVRFSITQKSFSTSPAIRHTMAPITKTKVDGRRRGFENLWISLFKNHAFTIAVSAVALQLLHAIS
jgi:hypothetical protein